MVAKINNKNGFVPITTSGQIRHGKFSPKNQKFTEKGIADSKIGKVAKQKISYSPPPAPKKGPSQRTYPKDQQTKQKLTRNLNAEFDKPSSDPSIGTYPST